MPQGQAFVDRVASGSGWRGLPAEWPLEEVGSAGITQRLIHLGKGI